MCLLICIQNADYILTDSVAYHRRNCHDHVDSIFYVNVDAYLVGVILILSFTFFIYCNFSLYDKGRGLECATLPYSTPGFLYGFSNYRCRPTYENTWLNVRNHPISVVGI